MKVTVRKKWIIWIFSICFVAVLTNIECVRAGDMQRNDIQGRTVSVASSTLSFNISSTGTAKVVCRIQGKSGVTKTTVKVQLQKNRAGVWTTVRNWSKTGGENLTLSKTYKVSKGTYRAVAKVSADHEVKSLISRDAMY